MYNGATNETGRPQVMWIMMFTSWCPYCESEVPYTQEFYDIYEDSGLVVIGMGFEWGLHIIVKNGRQDMDLLIH